MHIFNVNFRYGVQPLHQTFMFSRFNLKKCAVLFKKIGISRHIGFEKYNQFFQEVSCILTLNKFVEI